MKTFIAFVVAILSFVFLSHPVTTCLLIWFTLGVTLVAWLEDMEYVEKGFVEPVSPEDAGMWLICQLFPPLVVLCVVGSLIMDDETARTDVARWFRVRIIDPLKNLVEESNFQSPFTWD